MGSENDSGGNDGGGPSTAADRRGTSARDRAALDRAMSVGGGDSGGFPNSATIGPVDLGLEAGMTDRERRQMEKDTTLSRSMLDANARNNFKNPLNINNPVDRMLSRLGTNLGFTPDPANASHMAVMGPGLLALGAGTGLPMTTIAPFMGNPSKSGAVDLGMGLVGLGGLNSLQSAFTGQTLGDYAFGAPEDTPTISPQSTTYANNQSQPSLLSDGEDIRDNGNYSPVLSVGDPVTEPTAPLLLDVAYNRPSYKRKSSWWEGNRFNVAPIERI